MQYDAHAEKKASDILYDHGSTDTWKVIINIRENRGSLGFNDKE